MTGAAAAVAVIAVAAVMAVGAVAAACGPRPAVPAALAGQAAATATAPDAAPDPASEPPLSAARILADVRWLCDPARAGRGSFQPGAAATADWLEAEFAAAGYEVSRQPIHDGAVNVVAIRRAPGAGGSRAVLVGAHYDHLGVDATGTVYPGADDNASGTAVLLALARDAAARDHTRTLVFIAFGAEESGLEGSYAYVRAPAWPLDRTVALINFDMVGRDFFELGSSKEATAAVIGLDVEPAWRAVAERAAVLHGLTIVTAPARFLTLFGEDYRTDDWPFRNLGVRSIHISTGLHPDYHKPTDTVDRLVPGQMERVAALAAALLASIAGER
jgi:hypothetical protein